MIFHVFARVAWSFANFCARALAHTENILCHWAHVTLVLNHVCICSDPSFNFNGFVLILGRWSLDCTNERNEPFDQAIFITRFLLSDPTMQRPEPLTNLRLENLQIFRSLYISSSILSKRGSFYLVAPSLKTSCLPCRGPRVSTISFWISASMFWFFIRRSKTADLLWNLVYIILGLHCPYINET